MIKEKTYANNWKDYELIDAGGEKKLERWGDIITIRPERQAYFQSGLPFEEWYKLAHWEYREKGNKPGKWSKVNNPPSDFWPISFGDLTYNLELTKYKHLGLFPEQIVNWNFLKDFSSENHKVLNLFAYTGASSLIAKSKGADVVHVDSVKQMITWARKNMESSELDGIKWIHEDALKFAQKELKRERKYDCIIMDPPAWGIGAKKEHWKIEDKLETLIATAYQLLNKGGVLIVNTYSPKVELKELDHICGKYFGNTKVESSELWMKTYSKKDLFFGHLVRASK